MSTRIQTLNPETTTGKSKELFNAVNTKLGFIPNLIKVFEKVIRSRIVEYMEKNSLFNPGQHGFRAGRSDHALVNY